MIRKLITPIFWLWLFGFSHTLMAQEFSYGFRAGLNFNNLRGDLEPGETYETNTGFHVGGTFNLNLTDLVGLRGELMYSQAGVRQKYEGESFFDFQNTDGQRIRIDNLQRNYTISVTNSSINIPVTFYYRAFPWLEIAGGGYGSFVFTSIGGGNIELILPNQSDPIEITMDYRYFSDEIGDTEINPATASVITVGNSRLAAPETITAYYEYPEKDGNVFRRLDFGLTASARIFLSQGLFVGGQVFYGLNDVTNDFYDRSFRTGEARTDVDNSLIFQGSVGFSF